MMSKPLRILTIEDRLIPSSIIGVVRPFLALQKKGEVQFRLRYTRFYTEKDIQESDVIVLCRNMRPEDLQIIALVRKNNKKLIYDIDDNFFDLSTSTALGRYHRHPVHLYVVSSMIRYADCVRVYSDPMYEIASALNPTGVVKVKSYFDFSLLKNTGNKKDDKIRIVYATSRGNADPLVQICISAIKRILETYPDRVEFYTFGYLPESLKRFNNVVLLKYIHNYREYISFFNSCHFDIGLAPGLDDRFHNSKTNNKFREYGAMRVCGVYSNTQIYRDCVIDHENGLLVDNTIDGWYQAMKELVENSALRNKIKEQALDSVKKNYSLENTLEDWRAILRRNAVSNTKFCAIISLSIAILLDDQIEYESARLQALYNLLNFCGIKFEIFSLHSADLNELKSFDVLICSFPNKKVAQNVQELYDYHKFSNIIVDSFEPYTEVRAFPDVVFTNTEQREKNCFPISDYYSFEDIDINQLALSKIINQKNESYESSRMYYFGELLKNREVLCSANNATFLWALLLERYEGTNLVLPGSFAHRMLSKGKKVLVCGVKKIVRPFQKIYVRAKNKFLFSICALDDYIRVNIIKKY